MRIQLLCFDDCPGHAELHNRLPFLLEQAGVDAVIEEHRIESEDAAHAHHFLGSPTLRIDDHDVDPGAASRRDNGLSCRLYPTGEGVQRTPPDTWVIDALRAARPSPSTADGDH